jgi:hypothetical protein
MTVTYSLCGRSASGGSGWRCRLRIGRLWPRANSSANVGGQSFHLFGPDEENEIRLPSAFRDKGFLLCGPKISLSYLGKCAFEGSISPGDKRAIAAQSLQLAVSIRRVIVALLLCPALQGDGNSCGQLNIHCGFGLPQ